jgi:hypothetical protein
MRRALVVLLAAAACSGVACTAFDFARPGDTPADASADANGPADAGDAGTGVSFLSVDQAAKLCAQLFACPRLAEAIELSTAIPLNTPASPLSFSSCMDWVAGPVDPARPGLALQQQILGAVAAASSCSAALSALPVRPSDAGACVDTTCATPGAIAICPPFQGAFALSCNTPYFGASGDCVALDGGFIDCVSLGACSAAGSSCADTSTLEVCYATQPSSLTTVDCALTGRQCASGAGNLAACVAPNKLSPPCLLHEAKDACESDSVVHCLAGFPKTEIAAQTEIGCGAVGRTCTTANAMGVARCAHASGDACTPFDADQSQCQGGGTTIRVCIGGAKQDYDCAAAGLKCVAGDALHTAHCGAG